MNQFERNYIINTLLLLETILSIEDETTKAIALFTQGKAPEPRYHCNSKITDAHLWSDNDKLKFTASLFEAVTRISSKNSFSEDEELLKDLAKAKTILLDQYIPLITANTNSKDRINSVISNIDKTKLDLVKEFKDEVPCKSLFENQSVFFPAVSTALLILGAAAATFAFK